MRFHRYFPQSHSFKPIQVATLVGLGLVLGVLHAAALPAGAMVVLTNWEDPGPSQSMPKRIMSGCADLGLPDYYWISDAVDPATNGFTFGFYRIDLPYTEVYNHNVYAITDATGNLTSTVQVDLPNSALAPLAGVSETSGRICYHGSYSATDSQGPYTGLIGSSSLTLDDFNWQQYNKSTVEVSGATLFHLADDRLVFVARDENAKWTDFALLNSDLTVKGDCELLSPVSFPVSSLSLAT